MRVRWLHVVLPLLGGALAYANATTAFWDNVKMALLSALSVMAAGVLVRLARGLPFANADQLQLDEARSIADAVVQAAKGLRALMAVVFLTMGSIVLAAPLARKLETAMVAWPDVIPYIDPVLSSVVGLLFSYVLVRIFAVISGDVGLVRLQTSYLVKAVERKQAKMFEEAQTNSETAPFKNPVGYGKTIQ